MNQVKPENHLSFLSIFVGSLYDFKLAAISRQWFYRDSVKYAFFLVMLYNLIAIGFQLPLLFSRIDALTEWAVRELPPMKVENGLLEIEGEKRNFQYQYDKEMVLILDARLVKANKNMMDRLLKAQTGIIFLKDKAIMNWMFHLRENPYPSDKPQLITPYTLMRWRDLFLWALPVLLFLSNALYLIFSKSIEIFFCAGLIHVLTRVKGWKTEFLLSFNLAVLALGPVMFFTFLIAGTGFNMPYFMLGCMTVYFVYISRWFYVLNPEKETLINVQDIL